MKLSDEIKEKIIEWSDYPLPTIDVSRAIRFLEQILLPKVEELEKENKELEEQVVYIKEKDIGSD